MNTFSNFFFLICLIGWANFEPQQSQSDFIEFLGGYNGNDGLEPITPHGVIKEVYVSRNPGLLTFLHMSFSELFHVTQMWASLNSSNEYMVKPKSDALSLEGAKALKGAPTEIEKEIMRTLSSTKDSLLDGFFFKLFFIFKTPTKI